MGEFVPFAGMLFSLLVVLIIAGAVVLFPLSRRLGTLLELRIEDRLKGDELPESELRELQELVVSLDAEVRRLAERQEFTERLLERGPAARPGSVAPEEAPEEASDASGSPGRPDRSSGGVV